MLTCSCYVVILGFILWLKGIEFLNSSKNVSTLYPKKNEPFLHNRIDFKVVKLIKGLFLIIQKGNYKIFPTFIHMYSLFEKEIFLTFIHTYSFFLLKGNLKIIIIYIYNSYQMLPTSKITSLAILQSIDLSASCFQTSTWYGNIHLISLLLLMGNIIQRFLHIQHCIYHRP